MEEADIGKADTPALNRDAHPIQPIDSTVLSTGIAMPALSESEHGDRRKEALDTFIGNMARMVLDPRGEPRLSLVLEGALR
jgi:hypothetical protein